MNLKVKVINGHCISGSNFEGRVTGQLEEINTEGMCLSLKKVT